jgi:hypothetical protein
MVQCCVFEDRALGVGVGWGRPMMSQAELLVPGDAVELGLGDIIPADLVVVGPGSITVAPTVPGPGPADSQRVVVDPGVA